jgi:Na+-translocating ferredoxin:NAD+ oxidoreductase RnfD subunit
MYPMLATAILITGQISFKFLTSPVGTLMGILAAIALEIVFSLIFVKKLPMLTSAYLSGISVGILVQATTIWPYMFCAAVAILSKYLIRLDGKHIWNPSNLGIVTLLLVAPAYASTLGAQAGNNYVAVAGIWIVGFLTINRIKRFHSCFTYAVCFLGFAALRAFILGHYVPNESFMQEAAPITGPMYQLFTFFMITDPKTTVKSWKGQVLVAFLVAFLENAFRMYGTLASPPDGTLGNIVATHAPYFALTLMGPTALLLEIRSRRAAKRVALVVQQA